MNALRITLRPLTAFGTPLAGDTLFGQLCWALALRQGAAALDELLVGYTEGVPFAIVSDAFPQGLLPRPTVPDFILGLKPAAAAQRKAQRRLQWLPAEGRSQPLVDWLATAEAALDGTGMGRAQLLTQNTINRLTGTTGTGAFTPRQVEQTTYLPGTLLELHVLHDPTRLTLADLRQALDDIGAGGFGRDASTGLGKFEITGVVASDLPPHNSTHLPALHFMTLAPCAPIADELQPEQCFWQPVTRFGRHGGVAALGGGGGPFKRPILLARTGAVLTLRTAASPQFHGTGLGGAGFPVSGVIPGTVHQGYAPVIALNTGLLAASSALLESTSSSSC